MRQGLKEGTEQLICDELMHANKSFRAFASTHEGYAVLLEELEEARAEMIDIEVKMKRLWEMTKGNMSKEDFEQHLENMNETAVKLVEEAVQTAAMIQKFQQFNGKRV